MKECGRFGGDRYGDTQNDIEDQILRVRRHDDEMEERRKNQEQQPQLISMADMMLGRADFKEGKSSDREGLSAEMLKALPLLLVWRLQKLFDRLYSVPHHDEPSSWEWFQQQVYPRRGKRAS